METEINELAVDADGLRITVRVPPGADVWRAARVAFEATRRLIEGSENVSSSPLRGDDDETSEADRDEPSRTTKLGQIRHIAREILSDGHVHERREISKAVREAGLDPNPLNKALDGHFERGENVMGRPTYRDTSVPAPYRTEPVPDDEKPDWMRNRAPVNNGDTIAVLGGPADG